MNLFELRAWLQAKFARDEAGASMVEYILLVALIALAVIAAVVFLDHQREREVFASARSSSRKASGSARPTIASASASAVSPES
jgi:Flp pilus assembly pilin Flp